MISRLDLKLLRDLRRMKGQVIAVALVMGCGLTMLIMARSLIFSLESTRQDYYQRNRFADIFAQIKRAPESLISRISELPGVQFVQAGISVQVTLDLPGLDEPATGVVRSLPNEGLPELNRLYLRTGGWLQPHSRGGILAGEAFAVANHLHAGDSVSMLLNGRRQTFRIVGIVLSPEFIFEARPGSALPDNRTFGTFWMSYDELAAAFNLNGAFNHLVVSLAPSAIERSVIASIDRELANYGGRGAYGRNDHPSHIRVSDEIRILTVLSLGFPTVFLSVAAFMTNAVLSRLLTLQREQIAILKAFGFSNRQIVFHYLKFAFVMVAAGTILGCAGGILIGHQLVRMYEKFFRFPDLSFHLDRQAPLIALFVCTAAAAVGVLQTVRRAAKLPPAEAMRPEPPANYRPAFLERSGIGKWLSHTFRIAVRNLERKPFQALFTITGLALATAILIIPNCFRDSVTYLLGVQWDVMQRQDISVGLVEPEADRVRHDLQKLPGVSQIEPFRQAAARIHFQHRKRQIGIQGLNPGGQHTRVVDSHLQEIPLPSVGIVVSTKLAEVLGVRIGDDLMVEFLEGKQLTQSVPLTGLSEDLAGIGAYMDRHQLNRLLGEGDLITGASFNVVGGQQPAFLMALKRIPRVSWVVIKESLRSSFRETTAASINLIQSIYLTFAVIVAFGVIYNNASISLAERGRELATLRVIGFSLREVGSVLVTELVILAVIAVPLGLLLGTVFAKGIVQQVNTETVRILPILTLRNYTFAVVTVTLASILSAIVVLRRLQQLNLVGALRAPE